MNASSILASVKQEVLKAAFKGKTNEPYLSGDVFANNADVALYSRAYSHADLSNANVIFCPSDFLERAIDEHKSALAGKILILGNGDRDFSSPDVLLSAGARHVFAQNLRFSHEQITCLPIGLENLALARNGLPKLYSGRHLAKAKAPNLLVGPFSPTHSERVELLAASLSVECSNFVTLESEYGSPRHYADIASRSLMIASPRGNGIDTHRFWESMYRGSWPVVLHSEWAKNINTHGLPFIRIESWSSSNICSLQTRLPKGFDPVAIEALWWPYWRRLIQSKF